MLCKGLRRRTLAKAGCHQGCQAQGRMTARTELLPTPGSVPALHTDGFLSATLGGSQPYNYSLQMGKLTCGPVKGLAQDPATRSGRARIQTPVAWLPKLCPGLITQVWCSGPRNGPGGYLGAEASLGSPGQSPSSGVRGQSSITPEDCS